MDAGATTTVETDAGSSVARDGGASEPDSGSTPPEPVCGDLRCQGDESSATCPRDCPLAREASCTAACDQIRLCNPTISRNEVNLCFRSCGVATDSQIDRFVACTADSCSPDCLIGGLWECGDGRCEAFEPFIPSEVECPADCGESAVGFDCLIRCEAYALNGCVPDSVDRDCRIHCFESTEPERRRFLACGSPNDPRECAERTCLDDFGVVCPDGSCGECGDGRCGAHESFSLCPADCAPICGDGLCAVEEICRCEADCGACVPPPSCGDGACGVGESCTSCADDCGACPTRCGDGTCSEGESCSTCAADCGACGGGCDADFWISKVPFLNRSTPVGAPCADADGSNCPDGTAIHVPSTGECFCSLSCDTTILNTEGQICAGEDSPNPARCQRVSSSYGNEALICTFASWNLCSAS